MRPKLFLISFLLLLAFISCSDVTDIEEIRKNPRDFENKEVVIEGVVTGTFSLPFVKFFEMNDGTDSIRVISTKSLPAEGQEIKIAGKVKYYTFFSESMIVIIEKDTTL